MVAQAQDIHFLNERIQGDRQGELTCHTHSGGSLVDYTIASSSIFDLFVNFEILKKDEYTHLPQSFTIKCNVLDNNTSLAESNNKSSPFTRQRYRWTDESADTLTSQQMAQYMNDFHATIQSGSIDEATTILTESLQYVCHNYTKNNS